MSSVTRGRALPRVVKLRAEQLSPDAEGIARLQHGEQSYEVHVPGLFPGERAELGISAVSRHHARCFAKVRQRLEPHPARRRAPCPRHEDLGAGSARKLDAQARCHGCPLLGIDWAAQREAKLALLREGFGLKVAELEYDPGGEFGYRHSAKRVAHQLRGGLHLGSHNRRSHAFADMAGCRVDHPLIEAGFARVVQACQQLQITAYNEQSRDGLLRHVWAKTNGREVALLLVFARDEPAPAEALGQALVDVAHLSWCVQSDEGNNMRGSQAFALHGNDRLHFELAGVAIEVQSQGFLQPNPQVAAMAYEGLLRDTQHKLLSGERALDLYAGAGVTTARLRQNFAQVFACDAHAESAGRHGVETKTAEAMLTDVALQASHFDLVVANPPRSGLGTDVSAALRRLDADRLHIMSCSPASLVRDLERLTQGSSEATTKAEHSAPGPDRAWKLAGLRAFDTLPHTAHVELVAHLTR